ncbi:nuclear transport factor 2 family protein [Sporosarcina sp. NCCP-2716]|uniref:nuclear transport factor 2 family protein n=1 Tax=Sporosarcina sp. NCCP-2716 TaxID=2943679 RepID=UPI00203BED48|nr:nuclear transport factor 2 family protein [Sporosarcina sp. NCCP-2716]
MKKTAGVIGTAALVLMLGACSGGDSSKDDGQGSVDDGEQTNEFGSVDHGVKDEGKADDGIGFSLTDGKIEEAAGVPAEHKEAIRKAFSDYIDTLNAGDVKAYLGTLSSEGYNLEEERQATEELLATRTLTRTPDDVTIVAYTDKEAQVFSTMETAVKDKESGAGDVSTGRQVTVMVHEDGSWKVKSVHYIGDLENAE